MDTLTTAERSRNMAAIKGKDTKPELFIRKLLFAEGYRYRIHSKNIPGHPDLWMKKYNTAIYVNGCFWHRHNGCRYCYMPKSKIDYWQAKFNRNIERDKEVQKELEERQIRCLIIWECTIKKAQKKNGNTNEVIEDIKAFLESEDSYCEI